MRQEKSIANSTGTLFVVATPIGNLSEITLRALEVLRCVDFVACEDTRETAVLLSHYQISKPLVTYHKHNENVAADKILARVLNGESAAVVSDRGMPGISDPGNIIVNKARAAGVPLTVISGASALINALVLSGFPTDRFCFLGFLPEKNKERTALLQKYSALPDTLIVYSAPHNIRDDITALACGLGARPFCAVRELTKIHEEVYCGELTTGLPEDFSVRGEFVLIIGGIAETKSPLLKLTAQEHLRLYLDAGMDKKEAIKLTASERGLPKNEIYKLLFDSNQKND